MTTFLKLLCKLLSTQCLNLIVDLAFDELDQRGEIIWEQDLNNQDQN